MNRCRAYIMGIKITEVYENLFQDIEIIHFRESSLNINYFNKLMIIFLITKYAITNKGFRAICLYRILNFSFRNKKSKLLFFLKIINFFINQIEIEYHAEIGPGLLIPHAQCIVIGPATIGKHVGISQGVTIGASFDKEKDGRKFAIIGDNVWIGTGAKVIGPVSIGKNSIIGANAVVVKDIPPNSIAVGIPAQVIGKNDYFLKYHTKKINQ